MKPPPFRYHDPETLDDALALLGRSDNAKLLAGGQSLMPMLNMRFVFPSDVIDLNKVRTLSYLREETDGALSVGAMTRQRDLEFSDIVRNRFPLIHQAILQIGHRQTRNRGTVGGSLCHLDPSAELVAVAAAHDAVVHVAGPDGPREIAIADFPAGYMAPAISPGEMVTGVRFPAWPKGTGSAFVEFARRHGDFAMASAAVLLALDANGRIAQLSLTIGGLGNAPVRMHEVERSLAWQAPSGDAFRAASEACRQIDAVDDVHAPARYRKQLAAVLARRALDAALARAAGPPPFTGEVARSAGGGILPMSDTRHIRVTVNGTPYERDVEVRITLADFLRHGLSLTGTHLGCEHGVCGACTILLDGRSARSCLLLAVQADGHEVLTVEGIAPDANRLHPLQEAFREHHGLQCGFCTPGMLTTLIEFLRDNPDPTEEEVRVAISGNLCRCTGYEGIIEAALDAAKRLRAL